MRAKAMVVYGGALRHRFSGGMRPGGASRGQAQLVQPLAVVCDPGAARRANGSASGGLNTVSMTSRPRESTPRRSPSGSPMHQAVAGALADGAHATDSTGAGRTWRSCAAGCPGRSDCSARSGPASRPDRRPLATRPRHLRPGSWAGDQRSPSPTRKLGDQRARALIRHRAMLAAPRTWSRRRSPGQRNSLSSLAQQNLQEALRHRREVLPPEARDRVGGARRPLDPRSRPGITVTGH